MHWEAPPTIAAAHLATPRPAAPMMAPAAWLVTFPSVAPEPGQRFFDAVPAAAAPRATVTLHIFQLEPAAACPRFHALRAQIVGTPLFAGNLADLGASPALSRHPNSTIRLTLPAYQAAHAAGEWPPIAGNPVGGPLPLATDITVLAAVCAAAGGDATCIRELRRWRPPPPAPPPLLPPPPPPPLTTIIPIPDCWGGQLAAWATVRRRQCAPAALQDREWASAIEARAPGRNTPL